MPGQGHEVCLGRWGDSQGQDKAHQQVGRSTGDSLRCCNCSVLFCAMCEQRITRGSEGSEERWPSPLLLLWGEKCEQVLELVTARSRKRKCEGL